MRGSLPPPVVQPARQAVSTMTSKRLGTLIVPRVLAPPGPRKQQNAARGKRLRTARACLFSDVIGKAECLIAKGLSRLLGRRWSYDTGAGGVGLNQAPKEFLHSLGLAGSSTPRLGPGSPGSFFAVGGSADLLISAHKNQGSGT